MKQARSEAIFQKALNSMHETLALVPNVNGVMPSVEGYPATLNNLLVAGNERLPVTGISNSWSKKKSMDLLQFYGMNEGYDSKTENVYSTTARSARLKVAKVLGVSSVQLSYAAQCLADV